MNDFPMRKMNSSDEDILDISHAGGSGSAVMGSDEAINASEGRPREENLAEDYLKPTTNSIHQINGKHSSNFLV